MDNYYSIVNMRNKRKLRVLIISPVYVPAWKYGGLVPFIALLAKHLVLKGHEVTVFCTDAIDENNRHHKKEDVIDGVKIKYFPNFSNTLAWQRFFFSPHMALAINNDIKNHDIVHLVEYRFIHNIQILLFRRYVPYVLWPHNSYESYLRRGFLKKFYDTIIGNNIIRNASAIIAGVPSEHLLYKSMGVKPEKVYLIPNGVDLSELNELPNEGEFRNRYNLNGDKDLILYLGRIDLIKGPDILIEAFKILNRDNALLIIIGPDAGHLHIIKKLIHKLRINDRVFLLGPLVGTERLAAFIDCDVYVLPSRREEFGIAPLEAYSCGSRVITTNTCGVSQWLYKEFSKVVNPKPYELAQAIEEVLDNKHEEKNKKLLIQKRKGHLERIFSYDVISRQTEEVYYYAIGES